MEWLNYHHLLYFWTAAREGSIARASHQLRLAQPTISGQIHELEEALGEKLFARQGRGLVLTDVGRVVYRYADEIFSIGREMLDTLKDRPTGRPIRLQVGIANVVPKLIAYRILKPALELPEKVNVIVHEDSPERLLASLATHGLDLVLADAPVGAVKVKAFSHTLGECGVTFFASAKLAPKLRRNFPKSLNGAPMLLPHDTAAVRRGIDTWLLQNDLRPTTVGEFDDSALMMTFGQAGIGVFPGSSAIEKEIQQQYSVQPIGRVETIRERFFAISAERKLRHPAVVAISERARTDLFG
ncbi:MAG TPA: transcriptional activator NhaR [Clostridia bacterium]|nr:transcriptional activator NhaR [Clostridia bacterium]